LFPPCYHYPKSCSIAWLFIALFEVVGKLCSMILSWHTYITRAQTQTCSDGAKCNHSQYNVIRIEPHCILCLACIKANPWPENFAPLDKVIEERQEESSSPLEHAERSSGFCAGFASPTSPPITVNFRLFTQPELLVSENS
jgi:hypothetical protein